MIQVIGRSAHLICSIMRNIPVFTGRLEDGLSYVSGQQDMSQMKKVIDELRLEITETTIRSAKEEGMFNIWDFGGQHVYYTSHQTFLSDRAIYLLTMDITESLDTVLETATYTDIRWQDTGAPKTPRGILKSLFLNLC